MKVKLNLSEESKRLLREDFDTRRLARAVGDILEVIAEDAIAEFKEATPVGVHGAAQGGWQIVPMTSNVSMTEPVVMVENTQPYMYYVVHGTGPAMANPGHYIVKWVDKKLEVTQQYRIARQSGMSRKTARKAATTLHPKYGVSKLAVSVAYAIGAARERRGSKGNDFPAAIMDQHEGFWNKVLSDAVFDYLSKDKP